MIAVMLVVSLALPAYAANGANTTDNPINNFSFRSWGYKEVERDWKNTSTPLYLYITDIQNANVAFYARAVGYKTRTVSDEQDKNVDLTLSGGSYVDYVTVLEGTQYSIRTMLNERGYTYAAIGFNCSSVFSEVTIFAGQWSPDSSRVYTVATEHLSP